MPARPFSSVMPLGALLLAATMVSVPVDRVVLRSGQSIVVAGEVREEDGKLLFRSPAGVLYSIAASEVDFEAMARPEPSVDPVVEGDRKTRHPARKLNVSPEERDRLLAELSKKKGRAAPADTGVLSEPQQIEAPSAAEKKDPAESEARWRAEARAAREAVEARREELESLKRRAQEIEDQLRTLLSSGYDPNVLSAQVSELDSTRNRIESAQEALRDAQRNLTDLQDRARKAGVLPGWLRD